MPVYRMAAVIEYTAKREDSTDKAYDILVSISTAFPHLNMSEDVTVEEVDTPTKPDESGS